MLLSIMALVIWAAGLFAVFGCAPKKEVIKLKSQLQTSIAKSDSLNLQVTNYEKSITNYELRITDLKQSKDSLSVKYSLLQQTEKNELENYLTTLWNIDYYENGNIKSESGTTAIKTKDASSKTQETRILDLQKQLNTANQYVAKVDSFAEFEHGLLLNINHYADSVSVVNQQLAAQIEKQSGLTWWQKFLMWSGVVGWLAVAAWVTKKVSKSVSW